MPHWAINLVVEIVGGILVGFVLGVVRRSEARRAAAEAAAGERLERLEAQLRRLVAVLAYVSPRAARIMATTRTPDDDQEKTA